MPTPEPGALAQQLKEAQRQLRIAREQISAFHEELDRLGLTRTSEHGHPLTLLSRLHDLPLRAALLWEEWDRGGPGRRAPHLTGRRATPRSPRRRSSR